MSDAWDSILDPGETILWQGRPDSGFVFQPRSIGTMLFGLAFAGFALFWMIMASQAGGFFWMFGLIHFAVGIGLASGGMFWNGYQRRHTWYTLTDRRAFIATDLPFRGKRLDSYPITSDNVLRFEATDPPSLYFDQQTRHGRNGNRQVDIGFERIADAKDVYAMMRRLQRNDSETTETS